MPVEAWLLAGVLYVVLAALVARARNARVLLGFSLHLRGGGPDVSAEPVSTPEPTG